MKKLLTAKDLTGIEIGLAKGRLEAEGIACYIKNESLLTAMGEVPPAECYQELWVYDDADFDRARGILEDAPDSSDLPRDSQA